MARQMAAALNISCRNISAQILPYGATLVALNVPDACGEMGDVVLGFKEPGDWARLAHPCLNTVIGRTAGRIGPDRAHAQPGSSGFSLDGTSYILQGCDGDVGGLRPSTNLHGGPQGFDKEEWAVKTSTATSVTLEHTSPDGDQGFPGELHVALTYSVTEDRELRLYYEATTTKPTPVSLTNHAYFNLSAGSEATVRNHTLQMHCPAYNPDDGSGDGVPTGERRLVVGTCRDFNSPVLLGEAIDAQAADTPKWPHGEQFVVGATEGCDPNAVTLETASDSLSCVAKLSHPASGRVMVVNSSEPVCQTYYSTLLGGLDAEKTKSGISYGKHGAICLEMQRYANAVNVPVFPSNVLQPGDTYRQLTVYRFATIEREWRQDAEPAAKKCKF